MGGVGRRRGGSASGGMIPRSVSFCVSRRLGVFCIVSIFSFLYDLWEEKLLACLCGVYSILDEFAGIVIVLAAATLLRGVEVFVHPQEGEFDIDLFEKWE